MSVISSHLSGRRMSHINSYPRATKSITMLATSNTSQSLEDKLYALKYFISGQGISFVVLKATTSELIGPKKKHLNYLIAMTHEPNVSIPSMVKHLVMRAKHYEWPIVFKSLITMHHLITHGNENFIQNIASSIANSKAIESLCTFVDHTTTLSYSMSIFVRRYARYMNAKIQTYRSLGLDFCRMSPQIKMREVTLDQLFQVVPIIQNQFDTLLSFDASLEDLCNGIINSAFSMLYKDFVKLYIIYQAAIIRLLDFYFASNVLKEASEMLGLYKKFLVRMDKVSDFMPVIDSVGIDKSDMPNLSRIPNLPLNMLERHVQQLELSNRRIYERSLGRLEYGTLGRARRRSIKTPVRQTSIDILSPRAVSSYQRRNEELEHLDRMMSLDTDKSSRSDRVNCLAVQDERHEYEELEGQVAQKSERNTDQNSNHVSEEMAKPRQDNANDLMFTDLTSQNQNICPFSDNDYKIQETAESRSLLENGVA